MRPTLWNNHTDGLAYLFLRCLTHAALRRAYLFLGT